ncbi:MAG: glycosyltransferase family 1 protein [Armatimonadia bacterium]
MRIAIDARTLASPKTGDRTVTRGFVKGLTRLSRDERLEVVLVAQEPLPQGGQGLLDQIGFAKLPPGTPPLEFHLAPRPKGYLWMLRAFPRALRQVRADVGLIQYMGPFGAPCPIVTSIHDTVWRTMPETFPRRDRMVLNAFIPGTIRRAAAVTTGSSFAEGEILRHYPHAAGKLHVVPYAVDEAFAPVTDQQRLEDVRRRYKLPERFILSVGVLQPRKNIAGLIRAYQMLEPELRRDYALVITGKQGWLADNLPELAREVGEGVRFTGYVDDDELPALYTLASCFAYPSLYEGFGLPPVEAMACGTPVVTSTAASLPEVTGGAALLVDPYDAEALAVAISKVLQEGELREELIAKGHARACQLTWENSARALLQVLRQVTANV